MKAERKKYQGRRHTAAMAGMIGEAMRRFLESKTKGTAMFFAFADAVARAYGRL